MTFSHFIDNHMTMPLKKTGDVDISNTDITIVCNDDLWLATQIIDRLRIQGAKKIKLCYPKDQIKVRI
jgi:hypothetical protein